MVHLRVALASLIDTAAFESGPEERDDLRRISHKIKTGQPLTFGEREFISTTLDSILSTTSDVKTGRAAF